MVDKEKKYRYALSQIILILERQNPKEDSLNQILFDSYVIERLVKDALDIPKDFRDRYYV